MLEKPYFASRPPAAALYAVISGQLVRKAERPESRLTLGPARAGELVELSAVLGDGLHTYTLTAQTPRVGDAYAH
jgi:hypothetical protein